MKNNATKDKIREKKNIAPNQPVRLVDLRLRLGGSGIFGKLHKPAFYSVSIMVSTGVKTVKYIIFILLFYANRQRLDLCKDCHRIFSKVVLHYVSSQGINLWQATAEYRSVCRAAIAKVPSANQVNAILVAFPLKTMANHQVVCFNFESITGVLTPNLGHFSYSLSRSSYNV